LADDMGYGDVSALNKVNCAFKTPNLDEMCEHGIFFTDAHSSSAVCTPSRYSILTGRYNWRSKLKSNVLSGYSPALIEPNRATIANLLKKKGYKTAIIGKWHLGMDFKKDKTFIERPNYEACIGVDYSAKIENSPITKGFDYYYGISASLDMPPYVYIENDHFTMIPSAETVGERRGMKKCWLRGPKADDFKHEEVLPKLTTKMLSKIEEFKKEPFLIYFPLTAPHTPLLPSEEFLGKSKTNEYGDFVLMCDDIVGQITKKLKEVGIYGNTIVIFASDNGCSPWVNFKELFGKGHNPNYIFRGHKADIYEGGHRIPLIVRWPEKIKFGGRCNQLVCLSDFLATIADYFGENLPDNVAEDSVSNLPLWFDSNSDEVRSDIVHQSIDGSLSIRKGNFKLELCPGSGGWSCPESGEVSYPIPGQENNTMTKFQLYNLKKDIKETLNIIDRYPKIASGLKTKLAKYILDGRSTPGTVQKNDGEQIWPTIKWFEEYL